MQVNWKWALIIAALAILAFVAYRKWKQTQSADNTESKEA